MPVSLIWRCVVATLACELGLIAAPAPSVHVYYTNNALETGSIPADPVAEFPQPAGAPAGSDDAGSMTLNPSAKFQTMVGVGATFSEIGSLALLSLPVDRQSDVIEHLFDLKAGAGFEMCRLPVGSSDFATSAYSYDEKPNDYQMDAFSLARDEKSIIPVVQMALKANPSLTLFASPWSPPGWMKVSGTMDKGGKDGQDSKLIEDDKIYRAYALYLQKYLQGYLADGLMINRLFPENEPDDIPPYPGCVIPPAQMIKLVVKYLTPQFKAAGIKTELWAGAFRESPKTPWAETCLKDEAFRAATVGVGVQYCNLKFVAALGKTYPRLKLTYTEGQCGDGKNTVMTARNRLPAILDAFSAGCDSYTYWNMFLGEHQKSGWGWSHNSLVTIDRTTHTVRYNADYQPMYLVSKYLRPGDIRIDSSYQSAHAALRASMAFLKPDGSYLILAQNQTDTVDTLATTVDGHTLHMTLPAHSDCAITLNAP